MQDSSHKLITDDFVEISRTNSGPGAENYEEVWKAFYQYMPKNWQSLCEAFSRVEDASLTQTSAAIQSLKGKVARFLSMFPDSEYESAIYDENNSMPGVSKMILNDRADKCRRIVTELTNCADTPSYISIAHREEQFIAVGLRYLLPLTIQEESVNPNSHAIHENILEDIAVRYNSVPYHNVGHASMVLHHATEIAKLCGVWNVLQANEQIAFIYASAGHDIGHPGKGSSLLLRVNHPLAILYNEKHVLENYHAAILISLLRHHKWEYIDRSSKSTALSSGDLRALIIQCILWTDVLDHERIMKTAECTLHMLKKTGKKGTALKKVIASNKGYLRDLLGVVLKAADLSYLTIDNPLSMIEWTMRYYVELYAQRALEEENGLPLCEPYGPMGLATGKWFESNYRFCQDVAMPIARYLSSLESKLHVDSSLDHSAKLYQLTSPNAAVSVLRNAKLRHEDWQGVVNDLFSYDRIPEEVEEDESKSKKQGISDVLEKNIPKFNWLIKQANSLRSKDSTVAFDARNKIQSAITSPLERNMDILRKARYIANV